MTVSYTHLLTIVLEALPLGAVCTFAPSPTERVRETFSYFSLIPVSYTHLDVYKRQDRYYVSVLVEIPNVKIANNSNGGIGIDLGLKDLAIVSNEMCIRDRYMHDKYYYEAAELALMDTDLKRTFATGSP